MLSFKRKVRLLCSLTFLHLHFYCYCQSGNLVPNPSFEYHTNCKCQLFYATPWHITGADTLGLTGIFMGYANSCNTNPGCGVPLNIVGYGYQYPRTGNAYASGYFMYENNIQRGYAQTQLSDTLKAGKCYYAEFFVNLVNYANFSINNIAMLVGTTAVTQGNTSSPIIANPQILNYGNPVFPVDTVNWVKVSGIYAATGGEKYITIGNFKTDQQTDTVPTNIVGAQKRGGYYIDDVTLIATDDDSFHFNADAGPDTSITIGDSVFIGSLLGGIITTTWYDTAGNAIAYNVPGLKVSPAQNTWYVLEQNLCGKISRDTVYVTVNVLPLKLLNFTCTAVNSETTALNWNTASEQNVHYFNVQRSYNGLSFKTVGQLPAKNGALNQYSYVDESPELSRFTKWFYRIETTDKDGKRTYSPVRQVNMQEVNSMFAIYPNPSPDGNVTVSLKNTPAKNTTITVTNAFGKMVLNKHYFEQKTLNVQISGSPGIYFLNIVNQTTGFHEVKKLIIQ